MKGIFKTAATFGAGYGAGYAAANKDKIKNDFMSSRPVQRHADKLQARSEKIKSYKK